MNELASIRRLLKLLIAVVFVSLAIISASSIVASRTSQRVKEISQYNNRLNEENKAATDTLLVNFTSYMECLVLRDVKLYEELGREAYIRRCNSILVPPPASSGTSTTTSTTISTSDSVNLGE